ncbi:MAG: class I SAM-dependent methyltransferase [Bacteroidetes bacterium]|nr:class I SAM-dependent methyltransferase [Bacteroidota bacterium]
MNRDHWNELAERFENEVMDMVQTDRNRVLRQMVSSIPETHRSTLVDLGCGIGTFIKTFGDLFDEVVGVDLSKRMLSRARRQCADLPHTSWLCADLKNAAEKLGEHADLTVCLNVITSGELRRRKSQWTSLKKVTRRDGYLIVGVPSLESAKMVSEVEDDDDSDITDDGLVSRDGVYQKFFSREEIREALIKRGFDVCSIKRVYYDWSEEGMPEPPKNADGYPWDWACLARRAA